MDTGDLWHQQESIGFPLVIGADVDKGSFVIVQVSSEGGDNAQWLLQGPLISPGTWINGMAERIDGPTSFCKELERQESGRDAFSFAIAFFLNEPQDQVEFNPSGDGVLTTVVRRVDGTAHVADDGGFRSISTPHLYLTPPELELGRESAGYLEIIGDSAGFSSVEHRPQLYAGLPDIWRSEHDELQLHWRGSTLKDAESRTYQAAWQFALYGAALGLFGNFAIALVQIAWDAKMDGERPQRPRDRAKIAIRPIGKKWTYYLELNGHTEFSSRRYSSKAAAEQAAKSVLPVLHAVTVEPSGPNEQAGD